MVWASFGAGVIVMPDIQMIIESDFSWMTYAVKNSQGENNDGKLQMLV